MRIELRELQRTLGISSIYVTHDQEEALAISDRVIVMNDGKIEQIGTPDDIYSSPASTFVADFVGSANLLAGRVVGDEQQSGSLFFQLNSGERLRMLSSAPLGATTAAIRTALIEIHRGRVDRGDRNTLQGKVVRRLFHGDFVEYLVNCGGHSVSVRRPPTELVAEGDAVTLSFSVENTVPLER
jgi:ABC-type Fe3+/spermidine/putrescine transport system ATPase subunit